MAKFITVTQVKDKQGEYNEETGSYETETVDIPTVINAEAIRCFYPRHEGKPGTRITFADGGGFAVSEAFDEVLAAVRPT